jgi:hypothetical protein
MLAAAHLTDNLKPRAKTIGPRAGKRGGPTMLLQDKNAMICGGGGAISGALARVFAREAARSLLPATATIANLTCGLLTD